MSRRLVFPKPIELTTWPTVAHTELPKEKRDVYLARQKSVELYVAGVSINDIERRTKVNRYILYRLLRRCLAPHPDGRIQGFRALLPNHRIATYRRHGSPKMTGSRGHRGLIGAFSHLLSERPELRDWIDQSLSKRALDVTEITGTAKVRLGNIRQFHEQFIDQCRALGLTKIDYPLNTKTGGIVTFSRYVREALQERFSSMARAAGATHLKGRLTERVLPTPAARAPFDSVEFDAHRVDVRLKVLEIDPLGVPTEYEIERVWLLVILDVFTRAVVGHNIVIAPEYGRFDVIRTIELALTPHVPRKLSLPDLTYPAQGGFPSAVWKELGYACWGWFRLDNAAANLAEDTLTTLSEFVGCHIDAGPPYHPDSRPFIERFFGTIARKLTHRLPGTTGSDPKDLQRRLNDPKGNLRLLLSVDELEDVMEVAIADYNGTPHGSLAGRTPLEMMGACVRGQGQLPRILPEPRRRTLCLLQRARCCTVRAYAKSGQRPHISLFGVAHTNDALSDSAALVGQRLFVYYNPSDMRVARAFLPDGSELGELRARGEWGRCRHTLTLRQEIIRLRRVGQLRYLESASPFDAYIELQRSRAGKDRRRASALAAMRKLLGERRATPAAPSSAGESTQNTPEEGTARPRRKRTKPKRLEIGTGHSYGVPR